MADKRRELWRRGQRKFALQAIIFCVFRKSRERSQKSLIFASGIPVGDRVDFFDTIKRGVRSIGKFLFKAAHNIFIVGADYFICQKLNILTGVCYGIFSCVCFKGGYIVFTVA